MRQSMKDFFKRVKMDAILSAILCIVLGVVLIAWPGETINIVCKVLAAGLIILGIVEIFSYITNKGGAKMKETCIFLNLGRGPIVVEQDLYDALVNGEIAAAGLDVLSAEPMSEKNPLIKIQASRRLFITPHIAWASVEARTRLMQIILDQVKEYFHM